VSTQAAEPAPWIPDLALLIGEFPLFALALVFSWFYVFFIYGISKTVIESLRDWRRAFAAHWFKAILSTLFIGGLALLWLLLVIGVSVLVVNPPPSLQGRDRVLVMVLRVAIPVAVLAFTWQKVRDDVERFIAWLVAEPITPKKEALFAVVAGLFIAWGTFLFITFFWWLYFSRFTRYPFKWIILASIVLGAFQGHGYWLFRRSARR